MTLQTDAPRRTSTKMHLEVTIDTFLAAWAAPDRGRRAALIERVWADDGRMIDPPFVATGRRSISQLAAVRQVEHPSYTFRRIGDVERDRDGLCFAWQFVRPDGTTAIEGVDIGELAPDGRLQLVTRHYGVTSIGRSAPGPDDEGDGRARIA